MKWEPLYTVIAIDNENGTINFSASTGNIYNGSNLQEKIEIMKSLRIMIDKRIEALEEAKNGTAP